MQYLLLKVFVKFLAFDPPFLGGRKTASKLRFFNMNWNGMGKWNFCDGFVCVQKECTIEKTSAISWCLGRCV